MNFYTITALKLARKINSKFIQNDQIHGLSKENIRYSSDAANNLIKSSLNSTSPLMIARFGATEMNCLANYMAVKENKNELLKYVQGKIHHFWWDKNTMQTMTEQSGFFPSNPETLEKFAELMLEDLKSLDILGSWLEKENLFHNELLSVKKIKFDDLEPYRHPNPWTTALEGKKVLVIHPFEESIRKQYARRECLFTNNKILPQFELKTIKAIQSIDGKAKNFNDWFEALDFMKQKISKTDFDIAIIGCGAYGFPLAAHVKRIGKKAVHLGGATQILFGIIGSRWERENKYEFILKLKNENWIRPMPTETPVGAYKLENSCYW